MTKEKAFEVFVREGFKHFGGYRGREIFQYAWYSQNWTGRGPGGNSGYEKKDWMSNELLEAFNWYLDQLGRYAGDWSEIPEKGLMPEKELKQFENDAVELMIEKEHAKWESQRKSTDKRNAKLEAQGQEFLKNMKVGEVYMVKFNDRWKERGMLVMEIDKDSISGFYLDHQDNRVSYDAPKKEGYMYTKPSEYTSIKVNGAWIDGMLEWDGRTFKRTRTYETKMAKFITRKIENPIVNKF